MSEPRHHHFIPQFYQRGFTADRGRKIWVYEKSLSPRRRSVRSVGMQVELYAFTRGGTVDVASVENQLSLLDDQAAKMIQKLEDARHLTGKERLRLCRFVSVMWRRTPAHQEHVNATSKGLLPSVFQPLEALSNQMTPRVRAEVERLRKEYAERPPDFVFAHNVLRDSRFEQVMYDMDWAFFKAGSGQEFLTSDDPVMFSKGSGLGNRDAVIAFPLSRALFLQCMWKSSWRNDFHLLEPDQVAYFNGCTIKHAHNQVLASQNSEEIRRQVLTDIGAWDLEEAKAASTREAG